MSVAAGEATCEFCRESVQHNDKHAYFEIIGWEQQRKTTIALKRRTGAVMHHGCMQKLLMGAKRGPVEDALF